MSGPVSDLLASPDSVTGAYLTGRASIPVPAVRRHQNPAGTSLCTARASTI